MRSASFASVLATEVCYRKFANQRAIRRKREGIRHVIDGHGFNQTLGSYVGELGGDRLGAALFS